MVFSDDSDFISLYVAIRDELGISADSDQVPFRWVVTNREGSLSATVRQFLPDKILHVVGVAFKQQERKQAVRATPESAAVSHTYSRRELA